MSEALWPYLIVVLAGFLPNEAFRVAAVFLSHGVDENSEFFRWIKVVATTLLAAVVARLIYSTAAALEHIPLVIRAGAVVVGILAFLVLRRSLVLGMLTGEIFFVAAAWWIGRGA
jgi:hypothetical protein